VCIDNTGLKERICQAWLPVSVLRPTRSDINVWTDGTSR
jgi:hypothetical protein